MGSAERSNKKFRLWKQAMAHFSLCFILGFFTGFSPTGTASIFSNRIHSSNHHNRSLVAESPEAAPVEPKYSEIPKLSVKNDEEDEKGDSTTRKLIIVVTPTSSRYSFEGVFLRRLANTLRLIPPPLLWIVVESKRDSKHVTEILRKTGIMYRHLVFSENFTDPEAEMNHQRNVALKHIEQHRLTGIVHFAGLFNGYDVRFFDELREIQVFGTWAMAVLEAKKKKVIIEGPVCDSSRVIGWHLRKMNNQTDSTPPPIHISSFGFNSSILWDPERWGRTSSLQDTSQESVNFVKQAVVEEEVKGIPAKDCSKIMLWTFNFFPQTTDDPPPSPSPSPSP